MFPVKFGSPLCIPNTRTPRGGRYALTFASAVVTAAVEKPSPTVCTVERLAMIIATRLVLAATIAFWTVVLIEVLDVFAEEKAKPSTTQLFAELPGP